MKTLCFFMCVISVYFATEIEGCQSVFCKYQLQEDTFMQLGHEEEMTSNDLINANSNIENDRIYINPESIILMDKKIYIIDRNRPIAINHLHNDANGYYICSEMCTDGWVGWKCCNCQYKNGSSFKTCQNCHRRKC